MANIEIKINPEIILHKVNRYLYGSFAEHLGRCVYEGIWVGNDSEIENEDGIRLDTVEALKKLEVPALRWPGGCFADNYHWMDGIGPRHHRPRRINIWWDQVDTNQFGTDEFLLFCRMIGTEPYVCLNVGSGTVEEARSWVEYCNSTQATTLVQQRLENGSHKPYQVKFWGIGNENWVCGGNMRSEYYADLYRRYATYVRRCGGEDLKLIACGSHQMIPEWDEQFLTAMKDKLHLLDYIALHIYSGNKSPDIEFSSDDYYHLIAEIDIMDNNIERACGLAQAYSTYDHPIGVILDEWGTWYKQATVESGLYQQNTMRDAIFTAASFHCFHGHGQKLFMTNMAQTINVLQSLVLTRGKKMIVTPTYYVYKMLKPHQDGGLLFSEVRNAPILKLSEKIDRQALSVSATRSGKNNEIFLSLVNLDLNNEFSANVLVNGGENLEVLEIKCLTANDIRDYNSFEEPNNVTLEQVGLTGQRDLNELKIPAHSIITVRMSRNFDPH